MAALLLVLSLAFAFTSCGDSAPAAAAEETATEATMETMHGEGKEFTSAYVCPMHCEGSGSDAAGECPVCGMAYVAHTDHMGDGHKH